MNNQLMYLETKDNKYPYYFSINVLEAIQNEYGSVQNWGKLLEQNEEGKEADLKAVIFAFKEAINEGIDIENEKFSRDTPFVSLKQVGRILTQIGFTEATRQLKNAVVKANASDDEIEELNVNDDSKNLMTTQNQ